MGEEASEMIVCDDAVRCDAMVVFTSREPVYMYPMYARRPSYNRAPVPVRRRRALVVGRQPQASPSQINLGEYPKTRTFATARGSVEIKW